MVAVEQSFSPRAFLHSKFLRPHPDLSPLKPLTNFAGFIFVCSNDTLPDLERGIFGLPAYQAESVRSIRRGMPLFLFNYSSRCLYGVFEATSDGGLNLDPHAWENTEQTRLRRLPVSRYPAQVRVCLKFPRPPLDENIFRPLLDHFEGRKFRLELTIRQVLQLLKLFQVSEAEFFGEKVRAYANYLSVYDPGSPRSAFKLDSDSFSECSSKGTYNGEDDGAEEFCPEDRLFTDNLQFGSVHKNKDSFISDRMNQITLNDVQGHHADEAFANLNGVCIMNPEYMKNLDSSSLASIENSSEDSQLFFPTKAREDATTMCMMPPQVPPPSMFYFPRQQQAMALSNVHKGDDAKKLSDSSCIFSKQCNDDETVGKNKDSFHNISEKFLDNKPHYSSSDFSDDQFPIAYPIQFATDQNLTLFSHVSVFPNGQIVYLLRPPVYQAADSGGEGDKNEMQHQAAKVQTLIEGSPFQAQSIPMMRSMPPVLDPGLESLHFDILRFARMTRPSPQALFYVQSAIDSLRVAVRKLWCDSDVEVFGSFATGLCLQHSDIDLAIVDAPCLSDKNMSTSHASVFLLKKLGDFLASEEWCESFNLIATACVPLLKCRYRHTANVSDPTLCTLSISIDITIGGIKGTTYEWNPSYRSGNLTKSYQHTGGAARQYVLSKIQKLPALAPLVLLLKSYLHHKGLSNVYFGGLGSYSLTLLVAFFLEEKGLESYVGSVGGEYHGLAFQKHPDELIMEDFHGVPWASNGEQAKGLESYVGSVGEFYVRRATETVEKVLLLWESDGVRTLGTLLHEFLGFFGFEDLTRLKFILKGLDGSVGGKFKRQNRHIALWIDDPLRPGINVGSGSFAICNVQASFKEMWELITYQQFPREMWHLIPWKPFPSKPLHCSDIGCHDMAAFRQPNSYFLKLMSVSDEYKNFYSL